MESQPKVAVISGASGALGGALARGLAARTHERWHIVALGQNLKRLEQLDDAITAAGGSATLVPFDFRGDLAPLAALGLQLGNRFGRIDALVLGAAMLGSLMPAQQLETDTLHRLLQVNCWSQQALLAACDPWLRKAARASVSVITCALGADTPAYWGGYRASKAALQAIGEAYQAETADSTISTHLYDPGAFASTLHKDAFPGIAPTSLPTAVQAAAPLLDLI